MTYAKLPFRSAARGPRHLALSLIAAAVLAGCAVTPPTALTTQDLLQQDKADRQAMFAAQEPITAPVTLDEAIARAIKYNLQQRLALMERALEDDLIDVQSLGMLPKLAARAGLRTRSNEYASSSESVSTGTQSLVPSTSQERSGSNADLQLSWNVLDFGLSYFGAKAQGNKALAAEERRRRVVADIIRQTRSAYWNAVTAERLKDRVAKTLAETRQSLDYARQTGERRLVAPLTALRYQRDLLGMVRQLETLDADLALARSRLASLMNLAPATEFQLARVDEDALTVPKLPYERGDLEALAMVRRAELREEGYLGRNAALETRMSLLRLLPNASLFGGLNYDSNKYLVNQHWADAGVQVSWNLLNVLSWSAIEKSGKTREQVAELRRQALRMTVLTQVNVAWLERERAEALFNRANELSRLQDAIRDQTENAARSQAETQLELVRARVETLLSTRARDLAYAELLNAQSTVYQAVGIDLLPDQVADLSVGGLARVIADTNRLIERGHIEIPRLQQADIVAAALPVSAVPASAAPLPALRTVSGNRWGSLGSVAGADVNAQ
ncbi:MAG: transporter [Candidatus Dactylopiibacterium carminicum]|uniref:TolC family protein n=2 Tax=Candidatus Dactylopiibacterium carminicum TaxID=857335 RepID=A0A272ESE6_9RHOO|nr:TolC family protein [Candidatus Dactylopiibacterium carminicum]PAS93043.1 MAG: transporter [Candidatus Dactylopiibacterium carminicum]PAS96717.1 MAG: transporter [Candidatus Dactylopiibacterium carminicum]